ncbi:MAG: beta-lactamase family protein [Reichenbachiella sp.]
MNRWLSLVLLVFILNSCNSKKTTKNSEEVLSEVNDLANRYVALNRFSGVILIADGGGEVFYHNYGLANYEPKREFSKQTAFRVGSSSSLFTAEIVKMMATDGKIDLEAEISDYLPEVKVKCTVQDLIDNESGLPTIHQMFKANPKMSYSTIEMVNLAAMDSMHYTGGDLGYNLLGVLIEKVTEKSYSEALMDFGKEVNLENTYFQKNNPEEASGYGFNNYGQKGFRLREGVKYDDDIAFSNYGVKTSAKDFYRLIKYIDTDELVINEVLVTDGYCYSVHKKGDNVVLVLSNRKSDVTEEMTNSIVAIFQEKEYKLPLLREPITIDVGLFPEYNGTYKFNDKMNLYVFSKGDSLMMNMGGMNFMLRAQSRDQFYLETTDAALRFKRDETGTVTQLTLLDGHVDGKEIPKVIK